MAQTVTRISVGFSHEKHHPWPAWQRRGGWPALNVRATSPNVFYYTSEPQTPYARVRSRLI